MMKKLKLLRCLSFLLNPKIENSEILESFLLLQNLILAVTQDLKQKKTKQKKELRQKLKGHDMV